MAGLGRGGLSGGSAGAELLPMKHLQMHCL